MPEPVEPPVTPPAVNEHGYPEATPVAEMSADHQAAYWRFHSKKWEGLAKAAPDAAELERLRAADAELATRKAADLSETERLQAERDAAKAEADAAKSAAATATASLLRAQVAADKGLTTAQAARLQGSTREELEADADALVALFPAPQGTPPAPRAGGPRGGDVGGSSTVASGAERYRAKHGKN
ncbi:hypothetical protein ABZ128_09650 [Streptomyces sp. NPDC006326]|uniref:hypothetical protein n=1 Tax=Streptomyces sp. NPDC006326 TaxID=3156752 RepID=UPI0033BF0EE3